MSAVLRPDPGGHYLTALLGRPFTDAQRAAATAPLHPQLVVAGAGSGKTTVMAARVVHAVAVHGLLPSQVLGLTFTNKAAGELGTRVREALARLVESGVPMGPGQPGPERDSAVLLDEQPTVATYHAYAGSLVRDHALRLGREPEATLLTEARRWQVAASVVRSFPGPVVASSVQPATLAQYLLDLDGEMSEHLVSPAALRAADAQILAEVTRAVEAGKVPKPVTDVAATVAGRAELLTLVELYRQRKRSEELLDFGDQVALAAELAETAPEVAAGEAGRFGLVLLDEYQDTGVAQRRLLAALFGGGHAVTAVGDPCQSIYGWRGASAGNLLRFGEHFPRADGSRCAPEYLLTSFRNGGRVLSAANRVSEPLRHPPAGTRGAVVEVPPLESAPGRAEEGSVEVTLELTAADEVEWLAGRIAEEVAGGTPPGEVAVLCRRRADFAPVHAALSAAGVPAEVVGLGGLLTLPGVADVLAVLRVLADPTANPSLLRLLTGPRWRIGPRDLAALGRRAAVLARAGSGPAPDTSPAADPDGSVALTRAADDADPVELVSLLDALEDPGPPTAYSPEAVARLARLRDELAGLRHLVAAPVVEAVAEVLAVTGLELELLAAPVAVARAGTAALAAFSDAAARFESVGGAGDLTAFLAYLAAAEVKEDGLEVGAVSTADTVKILTVHKAKGLEWDVVAVPSLAHGTFPSTTSRPLWTTSAKVVPTRLRGDSADLPPPPVMSGKGLTEHKAEWATEAAVEERRLAYVAVTRARRLVLASGHRWSRTRATPLEVSAFLLELRETALAGAGPVHRWCDEPGSENPLTAAGEPDVVWPPPPEPTALARRRRAAEQVLAGPDDLVGDLSGGERDTVAGWVREAALLRREQARTAARTRTVALPRSLSASQVVRLVEDPDGLAESLGRPVPRRPSRAARHGTAFHAWVEEHLTAQPLIDTDEIDGAGDADLPDDAELAALQRAFASGEFAGRSPVAVEAPFEVMVGGRLLRGRIDAVYRRESPDGSPRFEVVDWKTGRSGGSSPVQLAVYRLAWAAIARVLPEQVSGAFVYLTDGTVTRYADLPDADALAARLAGG